VPSRHTPREGAVSPNTPRGERSEGSGQGAMGGQRVSKELIVEIVERLKSIYEIYLIYEGAKPSPVQFKCGEEKIASRVVPYSLFELYVSPQPAQFLFSFPKLKTPIFL
jgi:hypothetical protein